MGFPWGYFIVPGLSRTALLKVCREFATPVRKNIKKKNWTVIDWLFRVVVKPEVLYV
jgi:hypothetical protein